MSASLILRHARLALRPGAGSGASLAASVFFCALIEFGLLGVLAVRSITEDNGPYATPLLQQAPMRDGLMIGVSLLLVPFLVLVAQISRLGAPARDRRLATYRLLGATPREVRRIAAIEALMPAIAGALIGTAAFIAAQHLLQGSLTGSGSWTEWVVTERDPDGLATTEALMTHRGQALFAPTDIRLGAAQIGATWLAVPAAAVLTTWVALRRVRFTPFNVVRRRDVARPPAHYPSVLFLVGLGGLLGYSLIRSLLGQPGHTTKIDLIVITGLFGLTSGSLMLGMAALSSRLGAWLSEVVSRPSLLMAARRLQADPYSASRTLSLIVLTLIVAVGGQALKAHFLVITDPQDPFYADILRRVDIGYALALFLTTLGVALRCIEATITNRRQFAIQLASGVPHSTIRRSIAWETLIPLVPGVLAAATVGILGTRGILGTKRVVWWHGDGGTLMTIPIPWSQAVLLCAFVLILTTALSWLTFTAAARNLGPGDLRVSN